MIDVQKQIAYWRDGAKEDWEFAQDTIGRGKPRQGLFFLHLAVEKAVKAHVCKTTKSVAPKIHNLSRLAQLANLTLDKKFIDTLADLNVYNLEGRYPDMLGTPPTMNEAQEMLKRAEEVYQWLIKQL